MPWRHRPDYGDGDAEIRLGDRGQAAEPAVAARLDGGSGALTAGETAVPLGGAAP